jgi:hypothetical protein
MIMVILIAMAETPFYGQEIIGHQTTLVAEHLFRGFPMHPTMRSEMQPIQTLVVLSLEEGTLRYPAYHLLIPQMTAMVSGPEFFPEFSEFPVNCFVDVTVNPLELQLAGVTIRADTSHQFPLVVPSPLTGSWTIRCGPIDTSGQFSIPLDNSTVGYSDPSSPYWYDGSPASFTAGVVIQLGSNALEQILFSGEGRVLRYELSSISAHIRGHTPCDVNRDLRCPDGDIDALSQAIIDQNSDARFDLNQDGALDPRDHDYYRTAILKTVPGDANLDRHFNSQDLVLALQAGRYEDTKLRNSTWATGDWNGDLEFDTSDLIAAFQTGSYERAASAVLVVPEPSSLVWSVWMICAAMKRSWQVRQLNRY